jgi:hypothetical protein
VTDIFLSYAHEDAERVQPLVHALESQGWSVFWDRRIPTGQTWRSHIGKALDEAGCVIVAWTRFSVESNWVSEEADEAMKRGVLVPVLLDEILPPLGFRSIQAANLAGWDGSPSDRLGQFLDDVGATLKRPRQPTDAFKASPSPRKRAASARQAGAAVRAWLLSWRGALALLALLVWWGWDKFDLHMQARDPASGGAAPASPRPGVENFRG